MLARLGLGGSARRSSSRPASGGVGQEAIATATFDAELLEGVAAFVETERFLSHLTEQQKAASAAAAAASGASASAAPSPPAATATPKTTKLALVDRAPTTAQAASSAEAAAAAAAAANKDAAARKSGESDESDDLASSGVLVAPSADGGFVVVTRQDAVEAMAYFIADCLSRSPDAQGMDPKQLQRALGEAFSSLRRARWRAVLGWGRVVVAAGSYAASMVLAGGQPPALYRALVAALWAAARMAYRAVV